MLEETTAIILAGGLGTRLRSEVSELPKVLAPVNGRPFIEFLLRQIERSGVTTCILATGHQHDKIREYCGEAFEKLQLQYSVETEPRGTGGALKMALAKVETNNVLVVNGDTYFQISFNDLLQQHLSFQADFTMALKPMRNIARYGTVQLQDNRIMRFQEKRSLAEGLINGGIYALNKKVFEKFNVPEKFSLEESFLRKFTSELVIAGFVSDAYFIDIGTPEDYKRAQIELKWDE